MSGPKSEEIRKKISDSLIGVAKSERHRRKISEGMKRAWARRLKDKPKKKKSSGISAVLERDREAWHKSKLKITFEEFIKLLPLNNVRADLVWGNVFVLFRQIDPEDGSVLNIDFVKDISEAAECYQSSVRRSKRLKTLLRYHNPPKVEIIKEGLSFREARRQKKLHLEIYREQLYGDGS